MANASIKMPVWPGPRVMVPMATDILLVGNPDLTTDYANTQNNYNTLYLYPGKAIPAPFETKKLSVGAHIMWTLPYALRRGAQPDKSSTEIDFPLVPNRWLITRFKYPEGGEDSGGTVTPPEVTAYIVQSDILTDLGSQSDEVSQYPVPENTPPIKKIGNSFKLSTWEGAAGPNPPFLQAVGPGSVSWSVAYDNVKNVFSLRDDLSDELDPAIFTYSVIGWYATPGDDVLSSLPVTNNVEWKEAIERGFNWTLGKQVSDVQTAVDAWLDWQKSHGLDGPFDPSKIDLPEQEKSAIEAWHAWQQENGITDHQPDLPTKMLCHSMVASVEWKGPNQAYGTGVPGEYTSFPKVGVGNTAIEAISSYMANEVAKELHEDPEFIPEIERALVAFQKDLIFDLANKEINKVETLLHNDEFESEYGGQTWIVVLKESEGDNPPSTGGQQTVPLNDADTQTLITLNKLQSENNTLFVTIGSLQAELFLLSVKKKQINRRTDPVIVTKVDESIQAIKKELRANLEQYTQKAGQIEALSQPFSATIKKQGFILKVVDIKPYFAPNDPVIMLAGGSNDGKLNAPGQYEEEDHLFVRFTGQGVSGIKISYPAQKNPLLIGAAELLAAGNVAMPAWNAIPKEAMDLWVEALILDVNNAALLASLYFTKAGTTPSASQLEELTTQVKVQQSAIWNDPDKLGIHRESLAEASGMEGVIPSHVSVAFRTRQPWTPIYLDWKVLWYPSSEEPGQQLDNWKLGSIDFSYKGTSIPNPPNNLIYEGRSIINTKIAQNISDKFASFENDPDYERLPTFIIKNLQEIAANIKKIDIVSQSMSGFGKQLTTEIISMNNFPEDKDIQELLGNSNALYRPVVGGESETGPFFPIRGGHFQIIDLWMVDSFGQIWKGKNPNLGPLSPIPNVYWSQSIKTPKKIQLAETYGQLPPRLVQSAKANLRFLQRDNDNIPSNSADSTNPICGWVMPNHLDNSLIVFDSKGVNQGSVIKIQRELETPEDDPNRFSIRWDAVPGINTQLGAPPNLPNEHLQGFITGLLKTAPKGSGAYDELLQSIDSTLWTMDIFSAQSGNMSILLGRPIAVVRADLGIPVAGTPVYNQSWPNTGEYYDDQGTYSPGNPPYMGVPLPVRVGDIAVKSNGVLGYFTDDNYSTFYSVYGSGNQTAGAMNLLQKRTKKRVSPDDLLATFSQPSDFSSGYVETDHLISIAPSDDPVLLTVLVNPQGNLPIISGSLPVELLTLPNGPVSEALNGMVTTFRAGPLLLDPDKIKMPTPAEINGKWGWVARKDVTQWDPETAVENYTPVAELNDNNPKLIEGWVTLSGAESKPPKHD